MATKVIDGVTYEYPDNMSDSDFMAALARSPGFQAPDQPAPPQPGIPAAGAATPQPPPSRMDQYIEQMPWWEKLLVGMGRTGTNAARGVQNIGYMAQEKAAPYLFSGDRAEQVRQDAISGRAQLAKESQEEKELYKTPGGWGAVGEVLPYAAVPVSRFLPSIGAGAALGTIDYERQAADNPFAGALGGAAEFGVGSALGNLAGRIIKAPSVAGLADRFQSGIANTAEGMGINLTAGDVGRTMSGWAESLMEKLPGSSGVMAARKAANQETANRLAAESIGMGGAKSPTGAVREAAFNDASDTMAGVVSGKEFPFDNQLARDLMGIINDTTKLPGGRDAQKQATNVVADMMSEFTSTGKITGDRAHVWSSHFNRQAKSAYDRGETSMGDFYSAVANRTDEFLANNLSGAERDAFNAAKEQYRNVISLSKPGSVMDNDVMLETLANRFAKDKGGFVGGGKTDQLYDLARVGQEFPQAFRGGEYQAPSLLRNYMAPALLGGAAAGSASAYYGGNDADSLAQAAMLGAGLGLSGRAIAKLYTTPGFFDALPAWVHPLAVRAGFAGSQYEQQ